MQKEFSAGGIVYKKKFKVQSSKFKVNEVLWLVCQHSQHKGWVFPKGLIGDHKKGESSEETAVREVEEETGIIGEIIAKLKNLAKYFYVWQGEKRFKTVDYFLMKYIRGDINNHDLEMCDVIWLPTHKVPEKLTYKSDKTAFKEALEIFLEIAPVG